MIGKLIKYFRREKTFVEIRQNRLDAMPRPGPNLKKPLDRVLYGSMTDTKKLSARTLSTAERDIARLSTRERKKVEMLKRAHPTLWQRTWEWISPVLGAALFYLPVLAGLLALLYFANRNLLQ